MSLVRLSTGLVRFVCFVLAFTACGDGGEPAPSAAKATPKPAIKATAKAIAKPGEGPMRHVKVDAATAAKGAELFKSRCVACHGDDGEGRSGIGPQLKSESFLAGASDTMLLRTINDGRAGTTMIPWKSSLQAGEAEAIVAFLRSWKDIKPAKLDQKPVKGDAAKGATTFNLVCSGCHGRSGAGYQETANGTGIGRKSFLDSASDGFIRYIAKNGKSQTAMRPFDLKAKTAVANLTDQEIDDVIAHLRKNAW